MSRKPATKPSRARTSIVPPPLTITGAELRALRRDLRNARAACAGALALIRSMQVESAIRLPFPGLDEATKALQMVTGLE